MPDLGVSSWNSTSNVMLANSFDFSGVIGIIVLLAVVMGFLLLASSLERYQKVWRTIEFIISSLRFTAYGGIASGIAYGIYLIASLLGSASKAIDPIWYAYSIGALIIFTVIGYGVDIVVRRILSFHKETTATSNQELKGA